MRDRRRNILLALLIIFFIYFEIHSCSEDSVTAPDMSSEKPEGVLYKANNVFFVDKDNGWIVGEEGTVARTADGGKNWIGSRIECGNLFGVYFLDSDNGWIVGEDGNIYRTEDGGVEWMPISFDDFTDDDLYGVEFVNDSLGFVLGTHGVYRTEDKGATWENNWNSVVQERNAWGMSIIDSNHAYMLGSMFNESDPEIMYKTENGGRSWETVDGTNFSALRGLLTINFVDANTGWGGGSVLLKTEDGGKTWVSQLNNAEIRRFFFKNHMNGFAVGNDKIIKTVDGGNTWTEIMPEDERIVDMRDIYFVDDNYGWIVGRGPEEVIDGNLYVYSIVLKTTDGGDNWTLQKLPWEKCTDRISDEQ
ncbi:MAG: YCF48-related protein [Candidatus Krumholzibacteriota bacterium]|nr:YCF48-related protein [Candidatus Krumholzibacteriota bacterium]